MDTCNHVVSSVSVDDAIRKRIKKIAAELDTSQGEVVALGVDLLEKTLQQTKANPEHPARKIIKEFME